MSFDFAVPSASELGIWDPPLQKCLKMKNSRSVGRLSGGPLSEPLHTANACSNVQTLQWTHRPAFPIVSGNVPMLILSKKGRSGRCPLSISRIQVVLT